MAITPTWVPDRARLALDFARERVRTVLWATGFRPDYSWLHLPVLDAKGQIKHEGGIVSAPGVYALGLNFMRRRKSSFMHGAEDDVRELGYELLAHLDALHRCEDPPQVQAMSTTRHRSTRMNTIATGWPPRSSSGTESRGIAACDRQLRKAPLA